MEKNVLLKRMKGLLALVLTFLMLFGNGMTVFAADFSMSPDRMDLTEGDIVHGGDKVTIGSGGNALILDGVKHQTVADEGFTFPGGYDKEYRYVRSDKCETGGNSFYYLHYFESLVEPVAQPTGNGAGHEHYYEWVETMEPSLTEDGLMQHKCSCGAVDDQYTIPGSLAYFRMFCAAIQNAPENATVEWNPYKFRCYTRRMMEELAKRPDVTLITTYTETDGTTKSFTIPAGQALTDNEMFYGFTYLGNLYGWN